MHLQIVAICVAGIELGRFSFILKIVAICVAGIELGR
jgi:hypothetical protein